MNDIQEKIMQANGINQNEVPEQKLKSIRRLIMRQKIGIWITKFFTLLFWSVSLALLGGYMYAVKLILFHQRAELASSSIKETVDIIMVLETILPLVIILAAVCSVFLYIRAKSVNLLQIHERLHNLEEMVKLLLSK
jgi:hypothetical protein